MAIYILFLLTTSLLLLLAYFLLIYHFTNDRKEIVSNPKINSTTDDVKNQGLHLVDILFHGGRNTRQRS